MSTATPPTSVTPAPSSAAAPPPGPQARRLPPWAANAALPLAWTLALAGLTTAAVVMVLAPAWSEGERASAMREAADARAKELHDLEEDMRRLDARAEKLEGVANSRGALLPTSELNARLSEIATLAERHGLTVTQLASQAPSPRARFIAVPIKLSGTGSPDRAVAFLAELAGARRDVAVTAMSLSRSLPVAGAGGGSDALAGDISLDLIWCAALPAAKSDSDPGTPQKSPAPAGLTASVAPATPSP